MWLNASRILLSSRNRKIALFRHPPLIISLHFLLKFKKIYIYIINNLLFDFIFLLTLVL